MINTLFTIGYEQRSLDEFVELLLEAKIDVLIDVRETAWSYKRGFSKSPLTTALTAVGIEYIHASFAGNPKPFRAVASSHAECLSLFAGYLDESADILGAFELLIQSVHAEGRRACLTCYERHPGDCHRGILAERWAAHQRRRVVHLAPEGTPRRVTEVDAARLASGTTRQLRRNSVGIV